MWQEGPGAKVALRCVAVVASCGQWLVGLRRWGTAMEYAMEYARTLCSWADVIHQVLFPCADFVCGQPHAASLCGVVYVWCSLCGVECLALLQWACWFV